MLLMTTPAHQLCLWSPRGHGRVGLVGAVLLGRLYGCTADDALLRVQVCLAVILVLYEAESSTLSKVGLVLWWDLPAGKTSAFFKCELSHSANTLRATGSSLFQSQPHPYYPGSQRATTDIHLLHTPAPGRCATMPGRASRAGRRSVAPRRLPRWVG